MAPKSQKSEYQMAPYTLMPRLALEFLEELAVRTTTGHKHPKRKHLIVEYNVLGTWFSGINTN